MVNGKQSEYDQYAASHIISMNRIFTKTFVARRLWVMLLLELSCLGTSQCYGGGWYVGNTAAGEWVQYTNVWLAGGAYRFTANAGAVSNGAVLHLEIDGTAVQNGVAVPNTGRPDVFGYAYLGSKTLGAGKHNLRVVFETGGISLDWFMLAKDSDPTNGVKASDVVLARASTDGMLIAPVVGYEHHEDTAYPAGSAVELGIPDLTDVNGQAYTEYQLTNWYGVPMYQDFDRRSSRYWDIMVDQLLASRAQVPLIHCRETADYTNDLQDRAYSPGGGWYEGRWLKKLSEAAVRSPQAASALKLGMFWESGGIASGFSNRFGFFPGWGTPGFVDYCVTNWVGPWFDNVPKEMLYQPMPGRPIISFFASTPDSIVQDGQMGNFMKQFRSQMIARYNMDPLIVLPVGGDVDAATVTQGWGQAPWVAWGGPLFTSNAFNGTYWGTASSGSRRRIDTVWLNDWDPVSNTGAPAGDSPGVDNHQPRLDANGNSMMWNSLNQAQTLGTRLVQEEGFYNIAEGNSIFRSYHPEWKWPNQHMEAMREFADTNTGAMMFEAEGCDNYYKLNSNENFGGTYRRDWYKPTTLDVYRPLHYAHGWAQMQAGSGSFTQMSAGFFDVWALDSSGQVWAQSITGDGNAWHPVSTPQPFTSVAIGKLYAWGIAGTTVYSTSLPYPGNAWSINGWNQLSGNMTQLDVGATEVWAVNASGQVFRRPVDGSGSWTQVNGKMDKVSVGNTFVWGTSGGHIYYSLLYPLGGTNVTWTECPNPYNIVQLDVGSDEVWGVDANGHAYRKSASGVGNWDLVDGDLQSVCVGEEQVWGMSGSTPVFRRLEGFAQPGVPMTLFTPWVNPSSGQVSLYWTASSGADSYNIRRATSSGGPYSMTTNIITATYNHPYVDTGVINGTTYYYVISAVNASGESLDSPEVSATPQGVPSAPGSLSATAASAFQINLAWANNLANNSGVKIERKTGAGGTYMEIAQAMGANVTNFSDTALAPSTQYYYRLRTYSVGGISAYSVEVNATTLTSPTGTGSGTIVWEAWTNIAGTAVSNIPTNTTPNVTNVLTSLQGPTSWGQNYGDRIRGYITAPASGYYTFWISSDDNSSLSLSTDTQPANKAQIAYVSGWTSPLAWTSFSSQQSAPVFLTGGLKYYVEVLHKQDGGADSLAVGWTLPGQSLTNIQVVPGTQLSPYTAGTGVVPAAPSGLAAKSISGVQINLNWTDNSTNEDRFEIQRKAGINGTNSQIGEVAAGVTNFTDTYLLPTTDSYYYRVLAANTAGYSAYSAEASASPLPVVPAAPNNLTANAVSASQINVIWVDNANNETGYSIERKINVGGTYSQIATVGASATNYNDTSVSSSTNYYYYRVRANNAIGYSPYSNEAIAATVPGVIAPVPPSPLAAIAGNSQVTLVWSSYSAGAVTYNVKRSTTSGGTYTTIQSGTVNNSYTDSSVTNGTIYYYMVSAVSAGNEGVNSAVVSATPAVPPVYTNNAAGNWSAVTWLPNPPGAPISGTCTTVVFANSTGIYSTNDLGAFTLNQLIFAGQPVNLFGNALVLDGASPQINCLQNSTISITNALMLNQPVAFGISNNITIISGGVNGTGGLTMAGAGTLVLLGTNGYSGGTTINSGILQLGNGMINGSITNNIVNNSLTLGGLTFNNATSQTNTSAISSYGSVVKTGGGTLTWGAQGGYTGGTTINGGIITHAGGVNGLGASWSLVNINSNAWWSFNGVSANVGTLTLTNGNCGAGRSGNLNASNVVSSGTSTIGVSEFKIGADQANGNYTSTFNVLDGTLTLNINRLYDTQSAAIGSVVKAGSGTVFVSNLSQSYKGSTTLNSGVWEVSLLGSGGTDSHIGQSSSAAGNLVLNGGTLQYVGSAVSLDRLFSLGTNGGTLDASGTGALQFTNGGNMGFADSGTHPLILTGSNTSGNKLNVVIGDNGGATAVLKTGSGSWTLGGSNSYSGGTTVASGTLTVLSQAAVGSGNLSVSHGAVCVVQNSNAVSSAAYVYLNGTMNLTYTGTNVVDRLYIGGALQSAGVWNAIRDNVHFSGGGNLLVTEGAANVPIILKGAATTDGGITLSWTNSAATLYYTPSLSPTAWVVVTNTPAYTNGQWTVSLPRGTNASGFYRCSN
jgi:autotransporter-associated beta strand protein